MQIRIILGVLLCSLALASAQSLYTAVLTPEQDGGGLRTGSGFVELTLSGTTLTLSGSFSGLSANSTAAHIHGYSGPYPAAAGVLYNLGNTVIPLGGTAGTISGSVNLTTLNIPLDSEYTVDEQIAHLNSSQWYVNIHSSAFTGGEIRGQIIPVPEPSTWALLVGGGMLWGLLALRRRKQ